jgi:uncharacterized membrane protein YdfJ with MMPL/SSD domain
VIVGLWKPVTREGFSDLQGCHGELLGVGILIDATIVRALLVPALVVLFGRWEWWLPDWLARLLLVEPSPLAPTSRVVPRDAKAPSPKHRAPV